jgi:hypothetical protein
MTLCRQIWWHFQGFKEDSVNSGFRPDILTLAVAPLAKTLELSLDTIEAASFQSLNDDNTESLESIEDALLQPGSEGLRPSSQFAKLITALLWLNRTEEACESESESGQARRVTYDLLTMLTTDRN